MILLTLGACSSPDGNLTWRSHRQCHVGCTSDPGREHRPEHIGGPECIGCEQSGQWAMEVTGSTRAQSPMRTLQPDHCSLPPQILCNGLCGHSCSGRAGWPHSALPGQALWLYVAGATTGQVCFTAISSNRACHHSLHCCQFSAPDHVLCVRLSKSSVAGVRGKDPSSLLHCTKSAVTCWAVGVQTLGQAQCLPGEEAGPAYAVTPLWPPGRRARTWETLCVSSKQLSLYHAVPEHTPRQGGYVPQCFQGASQHTGTGIYGWDVGFPSFARCPTSVFGMVTLSLGLSVPPHMMPIYLGGDFAMIRPCFFSSVLTGQFPLVPISSMSKGLAIQGEQVRRLVL